MSAVGPDWAVINVSIASGTTPTEVTYVRPVKTFVYWARDQRAFKVSRTVGGNQANVFAGERFSSNIILSDADFAGSSLGFVAFTDEAAGTIEGIVTF